MKKKHFCRYCLQAFSTEEILKHHIKDCFKINGKQRIIMPRKDEYVKFKNYERTKVDAPFQKDLSKLLNNFPKWQFRAKACIFFRNTQ